MADNLRNKLQEDMKQAMRSGDKVRLLVVRTILSDIKYVEIEKQHTLNDAEILQVLSQSAKKHRESITMFKQGNRRDLVNNEEAELAVITGYLPPQASHDEIVAAAHEVIKELGATGPQDKGKVMPKLIARFKGLAEGREISDIVNDLLKGP
jgi:uncharacterized protein YqeY